MTPDEYRHENERAHERRHLLKKAEHAIDTAKREGVDGLSPLVDAVELILRAVERLSYADERALEMRRECNAMIEHCKRAIELDVMTKPPAPIIIAREDLPAPMRAEVDRLARAREPREDDCDEIEPG